MKAPIDAELEVFDAQQKTLSDDINAVTLSAAKILEDQKLQESKINISSRVTSQEKWNRFELFKTGVVSGVKGWSIASGPLSVTASFATTIAATTAFSAIAITVPIAAGLGFAAYSVHTKHKLQIESQKILIEDEKNREKTKVAHSTFKELKKVLNQTLGIHDKTVKAIAGDSHEKTLTTPASLPLLLTTPLVVTVPKPDIAIDIAPVPPSETAKSVAATPKRKESSLTGTGAGAFFRKPKTTRLKTTQVQPFNAKKVAGRKPR